MKGIFFVQIPGPFGFHISALRIHTEILSWIHTVPYLLYKNVDPKHCHVHNTSEHTTAGLPTSR